MLNYSTFQTPALRVLVVMPSLGAGGAERWFCTLLQKATAIRYVGVVNARLCEEHLGHQVNGVPITHAQTSSKKHIHEACVEAVQGTGVDLILLWGVGSQPELHGFGVPIVQVSHAADPNEWVDMKQRQYVANSNDTTAHFVVGVCETAANAFAADIRKRDAVTVIHNGSDIERVAPIFGREYQRRQWGIPPSGKVLLYVGRFSVEKRPQILMEAIRYLPDDWFVVMMGWGNLKDKLHERADGMVSAFECRPRLLFPKPRTDALGDVYAAADVVGIPSEIEAFPLVMIEAMQSGTPVVITDVPVVDEVARTYNDGKPLVVDVERNCDSEQFAAGVLEASKGKLVDRAQTVAMSEFSASRMVGKWESYMYACVREWHDSALNSQLYASKPAPPVMQFPTPTVNVNDHRDAETT